MRNYMEEYQRWLDSPALSNAEWEELNAIRDDKKEIESRFFAPLEFGTAGLRGEMALGCRRMNIHVIRHATQAFAEVIKAEGESACARGIAICFDCRVNSERFAHEAASVMAANGIPLCQHVGRQLRQIESFVLLELHISKDFTNQRFSRQI